MSGIQFQAAPDSASACRRLCQRWSTQIGASGQLPARRSLRFNLLHPDRVVAAVIAELVVTGTMSRISEKTPDSLVVLPCRLRWNLETVVLLRAKPAQTIGVNETAPRRMAAVCATAMPGRSQIEQRGTLRHYSRCPTCQVWRVPRAEKAVTAWDDASGSILRGKIIERPHD